VSEAAGRAAAKSGGNWKTSPEKHRDKEGEISRKHGNTLIDTLPSHYGPDFAAGCSESERLTDAYIKWTSRR
jgi:hypothetical protein